MPKLLIIEDKPNLLETLKIALEDEHEVRGALSAEQGFLCLLNWQPDVVIMDYALPGMDGLEALERITGGEGEREGGREEVKWAQRPKTIMLSAWMDEDLKEKAMRAGADWCLAKPFDLMILKGAIELWVFSKMSG